MPIVYLATNVINGKRYVGATKHSLDHRRKKHVSDARNNGFCRAFYAAIRKYGPDAFEWSILHECESIEMAMQVEVDKIRELVPEYNITAGGRGLIGIPRTEDWLRKMSLSQKGRKMPAHRRAAALASLEAGREARARAVMCLNDGAVFRRIKDAADYYGLRFEDVRACAAGLALSTHGRSFVFSTKKWTESERLAALDKIRLRKEAERSRLKAGARSEAVRCISDGMIYKNGRDAARAYGVSAATISLLCSQKRASKGGLMFEKVN